MFQEGTSISKRFPDGGFAALYKLRVRQAVRQGVAGGYGGGTTFHPMKCVAPGRLTTGVGQVVSALVADSGVLTTWLAAGGLGQKRLKPLG